MSGEREHGFTLIETMVALIVFVACFALVQQSLSASWRNVRSAQGEEAALRVAQRHLATTGIETTLTEGETSGTAEGGFTWTVAVRRYTPPSPDTGTPIAAYWISVTVGWRDSAFRPERTLSLQTLRLAPAGGNPR